MMKLIATQIIFAASFFCNTLAMEEVSTKDRYLAATKHNSQTLLVSAPLDIKNCIFEQFISPNDRIENSIKRALDLSIVCSHLNDLVYFGQLLRKYSPVEKKTAIKSFYAHTNCWNYHKNRRALSLLIHAQTQENRIICPDVMKTEISFKSIVSPELMELITLNDDLEMAKLFFECGANVNQKWDNGYPIFFSIKSQKMAELFIEKRLNWYQTGPSDQNVLFHSIAGVNDPDFDLIKFYFEKAVPLTMLDSNGQSVLHRMAMMDGCKKKILVWAFTKMASMINLVDKNGQTALDCLYLSIVDRKLVNLFRQYGGRRAAELAELC